MLGEEIIIFLKMRNRDTVLILFNPQSGIIVYGTFLLGKNVNSAWEMPENK